MKSVGITGGIGSGKTFICEVFSHLGVPVYHADIRAAMIMEQSVHVIEALKDLMGEGIYRNGTLNRKKLAGIIFKDRKKLDQVNKIVHPAVFEDFLGWKKQQTGVPYVLHEAAILFESGAYKLMDFVITVYAPVPLRIKRIMARDGLSEGEIKNRMKNQWSERQRQSMADVVIVNDEKRLVLPKVISVHQQLSLNHLSK